MPTNPNPEHSEGYGAAEHSDDTRQAQHQVVNDAPVDVNTNAVIARQQSTTLTLLGANFEAGAARRNMLADHFASKLMNT